MAERAASMVKAVSSMKAAVNRNLELSFDHFRDPEEIIIRIGSVGQRFFERQRLAQAFQNVFAAGVSKSFASLFSLIDAIVVRNLRHWRHVGSVELAQPVNVIQN